MSGPDAIVPANTESAVEKLPTNLTIIRMQDFLENFTINPLEFLTTTPAPTLRTPAEYGPSTVGTPPPATTAHTPVREEETLDLLPNRPITLYFHAHATGEGVHVLEVLPSLSALKDNEACEITSGDPKGRLGVAESGGASSLHFTRRIRRPRVFDLELTCRPVRVVVVAGGDVVSGDAAAKLEPFIIRLQLHVV